MFSDTSNIRITESYEGFTSKIEDGKIGTFGGTRLSGGFSIKEILKPECSVHDLYGEQHNQNVIDEDDVKKDRIDESSNMLVPSSSSTSYCQYVLKLQEKIHQQFLMNNSLIPINSSMNLK